MLLFVSITNLVTAFSIDLYQFPYSIYIILLQVLDISQFIFSCGFPDYKILLVKVINCYNIWTSFNYVCPLFTLPYSILHVPPILNCSKTQRQLHCLEKVAGALSYHHFMVDQLSLYFLSMCMQVEKVWLEFPALKARLQTSYKPFPYYLQPIISCFYSCIFLFFQREPLNISYSKSFNMACRTVKSCTFNQVQKFHLQKNLNYSNWRICCCSTKYF